MIVVVFVSLSKFMRQESNGVIWYAYFSNKIIIVSAAPRLQLIVKYTP